LFRNANQSNRVDPHLSWPDKNLNLSQLDYNFLWFWSFVRHDWSSFS
jgi:hypothetical protein